MPKYKHPEDMRVVIFKEIASFLKVYFYVIVLVCVIIAPFEWIYNRFRRIIRR